VLLSLHTLFRVGRMSSAKSKNLHTSAGLSRIIGSPAAVSFGPERAFCILGLRGM
jgi:hypothetical protein